MFAAVHGSYGAVMLESQKLPLNRRERLWEPVTEHENILQAIGQWLHANVRLVATKKGMVEALQLVAHETQIRGPLDYLLSRHPDDEVRHRLRNMSRSQRVLRNHSLLTCLTVFPLRKCVGITDLLDQ